MRRLFLISLLVLSAAGTATWLTQPNMQSEVPVIYWATDPNPARFEQVDMFHQWLIDNNHTTPDGRPVIELRLETAEYSFRGGSGVIQGVSGVAADIIDCFIPWYQSIGLLADVTEAAEEYGFGIDQTYAAVEPLLKVDGRQYGFSCNVYVMGLWLNVDTLEKYGMEKPPQTWDFETFERYGREFVRRANPPGERQTVFFMNRIEHSFLVKTLHRSLGTSEFNETLTRCTLDDEGYTKTLERVYKWTYVDHIAASAAEESAFSAESGYSGIGLALFNRGNYASYVIGRWCLIRLRQYDKPPRVAVSHFPYGEFPNTVIATRSAGVYAGSKHIDLATLFLAYLASDEYSYQIVTSADAMPPNPEYTRIEEYVRPALYPNEWGSHEVSAKYAQELGIATAVSPFVPTATVGHNTTRALGQVMADLISPQEAAREAADRINAEIELTLKESPSLRQKFAELTKVQNEIDRYRREGRKVPLKWIANPFHRKYYQAMGWADSTTDG